MNNKVEEFCEKIGLDYSSLPEEAKTLLKIGINSYNNTLKGVDPQ